MLPLTMFEDEPEDDITCSECGSVYRVTSTKYSVRDSGTIHCSICGHMIHSWNGSRDYHATLKSAGIKPKPKLRERRREP